MSKKKDGSAIKAAKRRKQKKLRYQSELQRRKDQRERKLAEGYKKPSDAVTDFINQSLELTKWVTFLKTLINKQIEEMTQRQTADPVLYKNIPFKPWYTLKTKLEEASSKVSSIMETAGKIQNAKSEGDKLILMSEGMVSLADISMEYKALANAVENQHKEYLEYLEHPELAPEAMDIPDEAFAPVEDDSLSEVKAMAQDVQKLTSLVTSVADTVDEINESTSEIAEEKPQEEPVVEKKAEVPEALKFNIEAFVNGK